MKILLQITKIELLLIARSKFTYIIAIVVAFLGIWQATSIRWNPASMWSLIGITSMEVALILAFWTLGQGLRKQDTQVGKMVWATVSPSWAYIWGKFLGVFCVALLFSLLFELAAIVTDQFWNVQAGLPLVHDVIFPPLGWTAFSVFWLWFMLIPVLFGVAIAICINYATHGKRLIGYATVLIYWVFGFKAYFPSWMDITSVSMFQNNDPSKEIFRSVSAVWERYYLAHVTPLLQATQIMDMVRAEIPPYFLGWPFLVNRVFFLLLSLLLVWVTVFVVDRRRSATGG
ncbi:MAG: hypothetical protein ABI234_03525 [Ktedonobacteraceae bacterium]